MAAQIKPVPNQFPKPQRSGKRRSPQPRPHKAKHAPETGNTVLEAPVARFNNRLRKTSLKRCSDSMRVKLELYKELRTEFLKEKMCEFPQEPFGCYRPANDVHHRKGRGRYFLDRRTWMPVCRTHHDFIECNKKWARKSGLITYK